MMELVCPAGTPAALRAAADAGAHAIYCGFADETNARNFPGLNFDREEMAAGVRYAHARGAKVLCAINTFPKAGDDGLWRRAVADAEACGVDAVILADLGLIAYAAEKHPNLRRHVSVQAAAANADMIDFYGHEYGVKRAVLPRVLSVPEIAAINRDTEVETEVFVFGGLCVMAEGRCGLSTYATGISPNMHGACSPAAQVSYVEEGEELVSRLGDFTIHRVGAHEPAPYPTLCKGCYRVGDTVGHVFEDPASLDAAALLPQLAEAGVTALKIEGRQRSRAYVSEIVRSFRAALDAMEHGLRIPPGARAKLSEGQTSTTGAYDKRWR